MLLTARYVLPVTAPHIEDGAVLVRDDRIVEVGHAATTSCARYPDEEVRDFGLAALLPGFVDLHTHLEYSVFRGPRRRPARTRSGRCSSWRRSGGSPTEDWDDSADARRARGRSSPASRRSPTSRAAAARCEAVCDAGLRGVVYREVATMDRKHVTERHRRRARGHRRLAGAAPRAIPVDDRDRAARALLVPPAGLPGGRRPRARSRACPSATHLAGSKDEYDFVKWGSSAHGHRRPGRRRLGRVPVDAHGRLARCATCCSTASSTCPTSSPSTACTWTTPTSRCCAATTWPSRTARAATRSSGMGIAPLKRFMDRGRPHRASAPTRRPPTTPWTCSTRCGSGCCCSVPRRWTSTSFTAARMIRMATIWGARALRMEDRIGSLEAGKQADIVAVDLSLSHQIPTQDPYGAHRAHRQPGERDDDDGGRPGRSTTAARP